MNNHDPREELASDGTASGIESEGELVVPTIDQPFDPDRIDVTTRSMTVDLLLSRIGSGAIDLAPDFQRRAGIWTDARQSRLIESLLLRIPLPTLYAAEDEVETWAIVDGIQRLTTIARFMAPDSIRSTALKLSGLEYLSKEFDGFSFRELPLRLQRRLRETELIIHVIRFGTPEEVKFNVFARINTGGVPLSSQELRHALIPGKARVILKQWALSEEFMKATDGSIRDDRMADREMVLRFIAFRLNSYEQFSNKDFDDFLRQTMRRLNGLEERKILELREDFLGAMNTARQVFGSHAFRKTYSYNGARYPINRALFDAVASTLGRLPPQQREKLTENKTEVMSDFRALMGQRDFDSAISQGTGNPAKVRLRFKQIEQLFEKHST